MKKLIFILFLYGCVSVKPLSTFPVRLGATKEAAIAYFGKPYDVNVYGDTEQWVYNFSLGEANGEIVKVYDPYGIKGMFLYFKDGKLTDFQY